MVLVWVKAEGCEEGGPHRGDQGERDDSKVEEALLLGLDYYAVRTGLLFINRGLQMLWILSQLLLLIFVFNLRHRTLPKFFLPRPYRNPVD